MFYIERLYFSAVENVWFINPDWFSREHRLAMGFLSWQIMYELYGDVYICT